MNSFLMWVGGLLAAVLAALFAVPYFVDWNGYRGVFEEEATRILGRSVRVGGDVNLRLLPAPYVRFEKLRIADSSGLTGEPFVRAESFTMWLAVPPLLKGILEAERIELDQPVVRLAARQDGPGNWSGFSVQPGSLPFVPAGVALNAVHIVDGILSVDVEGGGRLGQIDHINGELNADSLYGPFSFHGSAKNEGTQFNLKVLTGESDGRGGMRLNARARIAGRSDDFKFEGQLSGLDGQPKIEGLLRSTLVFAGRKPKNQNTLQISTALSVDARRAVMDDIVIAFDTVGQPQTISGTGTVNWGARRKVVAQLSSKWLDLDPLMSGGGASPLAGGATSEGGEAVKVDVPPPWLTARELLKAIGDGLPSKTDVQAEFRLDQANLGGDSVGGLALVLSRNGGPLNVETLSARLPGSGRLEFSGVMDKAEQGLTFKGDVFLGGPSFARVKGWALDRGRAAKVASDGSFSINGTLEIGEQTIALRRARADFSGVPLHGGVSWSGGEKAGRLSIDVEGHELDTRWISAEPIDVTSLVRVLGGRREGQSQTTTPEETSRAPTESEAETPTADALGGVKLVDIAELSLRLKAGKFENGDKVLRNVDADVVLKGNVLSVRSFSFDTAEGLELSAEGRVTGVDDVPRGEVRWVASAPDARSAEPIAAFAAMGTPDDPGLAAFFSAVAPFRLAGKLDLGGRKAGAADIDMDGEIRGGRLVGQLLFDGGLEGWRTKSADITMNLDSPRSQGVLDILAAGGGRSRVSSDSDFPMRGVFKAVGIPQDEMKAIGLAQSRALTLIYNGTMSVTETKGWANMVKGGEVVVSAADARDALGLLGLPLGDGVARARLDGLVDISRDDTKLVLRPRDVKFGDSTIAGRLELGSNEDGARTIDGDLIVDKAQMTAMMSALLTRQNMLENVLGEDGGSVSEQGDGGGDRVPAPKRAKRGSARGGDVAKKGTGGEPQNAPAPGVRRNVYVFSDAPFDLSFLRDWRGRLAMRVGALSVSPGLEVAHASVETQLKPEQLEVVVHKGEVMGGVLRANGVLKKEPAGVLLTGGLAVDSASLETLSRWDETGAAIPMASGRGKMDLQFEGRALSPRALVSVLTGRGEIAVEDARVKGLAPEIVSQAADEVIAGSVVGGTGDGQTNRGSRQDRRTRDKSKVERSELDAALTERLGEGDLDLGSRTIPIEIVDGAARLTPFSMKNKHGVTTGKITIDIGQMAVDSDFKLSAATKGASSPWPPVTVVFVGPLGKIGGFVPLVAADALERELVVRKLERNVDELERLRRLDEEAAQRRREREEERRREMEAARAQAAEEAEARDAPFNPDQPDGAGVGPSGTIDDGWQTTPGDVPVGANGGGATPDGVVAEDLEAAEPAKPKPRRRAKKRRRPKPSPSAGEILLQQF